VWVRQPHGYPRPFSVLAAVLSALEIEDIKAAGLAVDHM
jgi:hypothetical protein